MIKSFLKLILILIVIPLLLLLTVPINRTDDDDGRVRFIVSDVPEGTAYVELLVSAIDIPEEHLKTHEHKIKFSKITYNDGDERAHSVDTELLIDTDSEIAQYIDKDGCVSLLAHTDLVHSYSAYKEYRNNDLFEYGCNMTLIGSFENKKNDDYCYGVDLNYLDKTFRKIKAAYVDENGHILGVTSEYSSGYGTPRGFNVNGDSVRIDVGESLGSYLWNGLIPAGKFLVITVSCVLIIIIIAVFKPQKRSK